MTGRVLSPDPNARACANCTAWLRWDFIAVADEAGRIIGRKPTGQCRANPPSIDPDAIGGVSAAWPVVEADDFCRGFEPASQKHQPEHPPRPHRDSEA